jgi:hypothetical protein
MADDILKMGIDRIAASLSRPEIVVPPMPRIPNVAESAFQRLVKMIQSFESRLDDGHEIGVNLVSFGASTVFHIESVGYYGPDIITFHGVNENQERLQLIQHVSQLSVLLVAVKKIGDAPRRIGFIWDDDKRTTAPAPAAPK